MEFYKSLKVYILKMAGFTVLNRKNVSCNMGSWRNGSAAALQAEG